MNTVSVLRHLFGRQVYPSLAWFELATALRSKNAIGRQAICGSKLLVDNARISTGKVGKKDTSWQYASFCCELIHKRTDQALIRTRIRSCTRRETFMDNFVINVQGLSRTYCDNVVLMNLNLQVVPGVVYGLLGEHGTHKTTLI